MDNKEGYVQEYPCTCHASGICWIVRHPKLSPPISYATEIEANKILDDLRARIDADKELYEAYKSAYREPELGDPWILIKRMDWWCRVGSAYRKLFDSDIFGIYGK